MDTAYVAWIRPLNPVTLYRDTWEAKYQFPDERSALDWLEEFLVHRGGITGVVLPAGEKPTGKCHLGE